MLSAALLAAFAAAASLESSLTSVAALPGEPRTVSAAGLAADETPILTLENASAFDAGPSKLRLVLVGADDPPTADAVVAAVRWLKTAAPRPIRDRWIVSALPLARFTEADKLSLPRWLTFQAPDLIVEIGSGGRARVDGVRVESVPAAAATDALRKLLGDPSLKRSTLHDTIVGRVTRQPIAIAPVLAQRYPGTPSVSYIPSVSWINTLKLASITGQTALRAKVMDQIKPWLSGEQKMFGDRIQLTSIAGAMVFAELAAAGESGATPRADQAAIPLAVEAARLAAAEKSPGVAQYGGGWTDDMFMASTVLARTGRWHGREGDFDTLARLLAAYAGRLQRPDGLFNHAVDGPVTWGRGNGFAAMGLTEALTALPATHQARPPLLAEDGPHEWPLRYHNGDQHAEGQ